MHCLDTSTEIAEVLVGFGNRCVCLALLSDVMS